MPPRAAAAGAGLTPFLQHDPWESLERDVDAVFASGYSVSVFTLWKKAPAACGSGSVSPPPPPAPTELLGARQAGEQRHPIAGGNPAAATARSRLPHVRNDWLETPVLGVTG